MFRRICISIALSFTLVLSIVPMALAATQPAPTESTPDKVIAKPQMVAKASSAYAISAGAKLNAAALTYLTEMYIREYPEMGKEMMYGTPKDVATLQKLSERIVSSQSGAAAKCKAIAKWTQRNIEYVSHSGMGEFPIDTLAARRGNCFGYAYLMQHLMRASGIPSVVCTGYRGDMAGTMKLNAIKNDTTGVDGHAWVLAYYGSEWHIYDPLFDVLGTSDKSFMDKWYFTMDMEGVAPYYEGMDLRLINGGDAVYRIDGRMMGYRRGMPGSEYFGGNWQAWTEVNGVSFGIFPYRENDGFTYLSEPERRDAMVDDQLYADGWISYGGQMYYVRPNGIQAAYTTKVFGGTSYYLDHGGAAFTVSRNLAELSLTRGFIELMPGDQITLMPTWTPDTEDNRYRLWYVSEDGSASAISVSQAGVITAKQVKGVVIANAECDEVDHADDGMRTDERTHWMSSYVPVCVAEKAKSVSFKDDLRTAEVRLSAKKLDYTGKALKPDVAVELDGQTLEADDYTVVYSETPKNAGKYKVWVKGRGDYQGSSAKVSFTVAKAPNALSAKAAKAKTIRATKLAKSKQQVKKAITVKKAVGEVRYAKVSKGSSPKLSVNKKTGVITVKKGTAKGNYKIKVKVTAKGDENHEAASKVVAVKIRVK